MASGQIAELPPPRTPGTAADGIAAELRRQIKDGSHAPGDRLPPERALAESFSASRGTIREALRSLEERGMVARRVGSGTFVTYEPESATDDVAEITSPLELIEVRSAVEQQMVRLAVRNATARDLASLRDALENMEGQAISAGRFSVWDEQFHLRLAEATHNPLMVDIYQRINHVRSHDQWSTIKDKVLTPERIAAYNAEHRELLSAIELRNADQAAQVVARHMERAHQDLLMGDAG